MPMFGGQGTEPGPKTEKSNEESEKHSNEKPCNGGECGDLVKARRKLEEQRQKSAELSVSVGRLSAEADSIKKNMMIKIAAAGGVLVVMFIFLISGLVAKSKVENELTEHRLYRDMYDSVFVLSKKLKTERDSLRTELAGYIVAVEKLQEKYDELASNPRASLSGGTRGRANIPIEMVSVRGGRFNMGCTAEQGGDCNNNERPAREVNVGNFSIAKYPVTQALWTRVMGSNPSQYQGDNRPVDRISFRDAQNFINRLNTMTGRRYRLPTEAEWEYAARGGAVSRGYRYAGSNNLDEVAWYGRSDGTRAVGTRKPNELGIHDMSGNVREWVSDRYGIYGETGAAPGTDRVLRGGGWTQRARDCRVSARAGYAPSAKGSYIGFRLAESR